MINDYANPMTIESFRSCPGFEISAKTGAFLDELRISGCLEIGSDCKAVYADD